MTFVSVLSLTFVPGQDSNNLYINQNISLSTPVDKSVFVSVDTSLIDPLEISVMAILSDWQREERRVGVVSELWVATSVFPSDLEMYFPN